MTQTVPRSPKSPRRAAPSGDMYVTVGTCRGAKRACVYVLVESRRRAAQTTERSFRGRETTGTDRGARRRGRAPPGEVGRGAEADAHARGALARDEGPAVAGDRPQREAVLHPA